ncbi:unnamed protein product [Bursaphelenchus xylophilus]|uniref:E3 ubiquitin-protein ligase PPP1R11 n=1 Tax=Bursaphelenchus xylophilus TaxID=6326 RepID=A0A1I7SML6_BURXY|nr:unnamed protein product [Bursaphelenchus xylophilus]CAG9130276.1 unnamed protein product [Bursaphelenchus xylophilus]
MSAPSVPMASQVQIEELPAGPPTPILRLQGSSSENRPHVTWTADTVDNENMGRLKSNCCCVYVKPRIWDDPSTWEQDENETENCRGHTLPPPDKK